MMLFHGMSNQNFMIGLEADGGLLTNDPAERYQLLVEGNYLTPDVLVSPADVRPDAAYSYALLDIASPGARRDAWTTEAVPDAPILAESPAALGKPEAWSGWVLWHSPYLTAESAARSVEQVESSRVNTNYSEELPFNLDDDLFVAEGPDDAYLIEAEQ
ncbi:hypothetical protein [Algisphaera agarilytica]|uniref:Uncharacterized protein n=1 Tax=Algisphaera agarilytica TaxID=1385975 RepID=A0A7X0LK98_9BACT|nr:hypothetical protein [Algisphaera agarilytica]MBB6428718.1 hypothetical protein [Algisphaera agarilytica]